MLKVKYFNIFNQIKSGDVSSISFESRIKSVDDHYRFLHGILFATKKKLAVLHLKRHYRTERISLQIGKIERWNLRDAQHTAQIGGLGN